MEIKKLINFFKVKNNITLFVIILIGVVLMLFPGGGEKKEDKTSLTPTEYKSDDEERLIKILSQIKGVGEVDVMITYSGGVKSDIAYDTDTTTTQRGDGEKISNLEENMKRQAVMSSGEPFVMRTLYPEVKGAVVVAQGAGDILVKQQIQQAVTTAMGIASHKVCVVEKKGG